ncbi:hypothetical protein K469DRAFT_685214 [Zopfia rhizophila CBS 207.26]|uniref:Uncharacterized protein n=1 Tax=Zopfia rhizophila CBS 207.26 TaxID=1314779 RepID=A0A6A6DB32_9PEZI|nr:hypothetical protein K469DRAFT_685214 [Zopfia rhizophila CBS 207.26]
MPLVTLVSLILSSLPLPLALTALMATLKLLLIIAPIAIRVIATLLLASLTLQLVTAASRALLVVYKSNWQRKEFCLASNNHIRLGLRIGSSNSVVLEARRYPAPIFKVCTLTITAEPVLMDMPLLVLR